MEGMKTDTKMIMYATLEGLKFEYGSTQVKGGEAKEKQQALAHQKIQQVNKKKRIRTEQSSGPNSLQAHVHTFCKDVGLVDITKESFMG